MQCDIQDCKRISRALCHCCQKNLCNKHFQEHDELFLSQLNLLANDINGLVDQFTHINIQELQNVAKAEFDQWRQEEHRKIDELYQQKCSYMEQNLQKGYADQKDVIQKLQNSVAEHIREKEVSKQLLDSLNDTVKQVKQGFALLNSTNFTRNLLPDQAVTNEVRSDSAEEKMISNNTTNEEISQPQNLHYYELFLLPPPLKTVEIRDVQFMLSDGKRIILLHRDNLRFYYNDLNFIEEKPIFKSTLNATNSTKERKQPYPADFASQQSTLAVNLSSQLISDICYCPSLDIFFIVKANERSVLAFDDKQMKLEKPDNIPQGIRSCTVSKTTLYLLLPDRTPDSFTILEYSIPDIIYVKRWMICDKDEYLGDLRAIRYYEGHLMTIGISIRKYDKGAVLIGFCDANTSKCLKILTSCIQGSWIETIFNISSMISCYPFQTGEWLITRFGDKESLTHFQANLKTKETCGGRFRGVRQVLQISPSIVAFLDILNVSLYKITIEGYNLQKKK